MKRIVAIFVVIALILNLSSIAFAAEPPKKPITLPQLKEITFIHYAKPDKPGKPEPPPVDNTLTSYGDSIFLGLLTIMSIHQGDLSARLLRSSWHSKDGMRLQKRNCLISLGKPRLLVSAMMGRTQYPG